MYRFNRIVPFFRYVLSAWALKFFSLTSASRHLYRVLGNSLGQDCHAIVSTIDIERGMWICRAVAEMQPYLDENSVVLELGTGWTHFYGIFLRLFFNPEIILFDVQDNRQLNALKTRFTQLAKILPEFLPDQVEQWDVVLDLIKRVSRVQSFEELYQLLGMNYIAETSGHFDLLSDDSFDLVFSVDVLEHVDRYSLRETIKGIHRILKPGGLSVHPIGIDDHLSHYAPGMSPKNYLRYSDRAWRLLFENKIQYFNRVQLTEFEEYFRAEGFELR